jgi:hypothetical protein
LVKQFTQASAYAIGELALDWDYDGCRRIVDGTRMKNMSIHSLTREYSCCANVALGDFYVICALENFVFIPTYLRG